METSPIERAPSPTGYLYEGTEAMTANSLPIQSSNEGYYLPQLHSGPTYAALRAAAEKKSKSDEEESITTTEYERELELQWNETKQTFYNLFHLLIIPWSSREVGKRFSHWLYVRHLTVGVQTKQFWFGTNIASYLPW